MRTFPDDWKADRLKDVCSVNQSALPAGTDPDFEFPHLEISNVDYFGIVTTWTAVALLLIQLPRSIRGAMALHGRKEF